MKWTSKRNTIPIHVCITILIASPFVQQHVPPVKIRLPPASIMALFIDLATTLPSLLRHQLVEAETAPLEMFPPLISCFSTAAQLELAGWAWGEDGMTMQWSHLRRNIHIAKTLSMLCRLSRAFGPGKWGWFDNDPICKELFVNCFVEAYCDDG